jgi:outer membrane receptor protein involved in Fe transport
MIVGARVETTKIDYTGNYVMNEKDLVGKINNTNTYQCTSEFVFQVCTGSGPCASCCIYYCPCPSNYYSLVPYLNVISEDEIVSAGNPNLKATYAYNFDFMAEKYFKSVGILSGGLFYKNLKDFIYTFSEETILRMILPAILQGNPILFRQEKATGSLPSSVMETM